jgi:hypothetical protein
MVRAGVMEKIMHKTSDATHECELTIDELDAVAGGRTDVIKVMGNAKWEDGAPTLSSAISGALVGASRAVLR